MLVRLIVESEKWKFAGKEMMEVGFLE